jgi:hypothetical protein
MKNKLVFAGLLISVLAIGIVAVGCASTPKEPTVLPVLDGTWVFEGQKDTYTFVFDGSNYSFERKSGSRVHSGTFEQNATTLSFIIAEIKSATGNVRAGQTVKQRYKVVDNKLTLSENNAFDYGTFIKK